jgi:hypothetical protein
MKTCENHERRLSELLRDIDFSGRYYAYCDAHPLEEATFALSPAEQRRLIASTGLDFKYNARDRFFAHIEGNEARRLQLNISFEDRYVELGLSFRTGAGVIGGPFHVLAHNVERLLHGPDLKREPRHPRLRFTSTDDADQAFELGLDLYRDARTQILGESWE